MVVPKSGGEVPAVPNGVPESTPVSSPPVPAAQPPLQPERLQAVDRGAVGTETTGSTGDRWMTEQERDIATRATRELLRGAVGRLAAAPRSFPHQELSPVPEPTTHRVPKGVFIIDMTKSGGLGTELRRLDEHFAGSSDADRRIHHIAPGQAAQESASGPGEEYLDNDLPPQAPESTAAAAEEPAQPPAGNPGGGSGNVPPTGGEGRPVPSDGEPGDPNERLDKWLRDAGKALDQEYTETLDVEGRLARITGEDVTNTPNTVAMNTTNPDDAAYLAERMGAAEPSADHVQDPTSDRARVEAEVADAYTRFGDRPEGAAEEAGDDDGGLGDVQEAAGSLYDAVFDLPAGTQPDAPDLFTDEAAPAEQQRPAYDADAQYDLIADYTVGSAEDQQRVLDKFASLQATNPELLDAAYGDVPEYRSFLEQQLAAREQATTDEAAPTGAYDQSERSLEVGPDGTIYAAGDDQLTGLTDPEEEGIFGLQKAGAGAGVTDEQRARLADRGRNIWDQHLDYLGAEDGADGEAADGQPRRDGDDDPEHPGGTAHL